MEDKRQTPRIPIDLALLASNPCIGPDARIQNLSASGAFIATEDPLDEDTMLAIDLQLPGDDERMTINARVVWTKAVCNARAAGMGIHFTDILEEHQNKLTAFVEQNI
jgi:uncharacterized protein (TIGR02266 family)